MPQQNIAAPYVTTPSIGIDLTSNETVPLHNTGFTVLGTNNTMYEYVYSICGITAGQAVVINGCGSAFPATTALAVCMRKIGAAQVAITCGNYGFVARSGFGVNCNLVANAGATAQLYTTATAGALGTTLVTGGVIVGAVSVTAASAGGTSLCAVAFGSPAVVVAAAPGT